MGENKLYEINAMTRKPLCFPFHLRLKSRYALSKEWEVRSQLWHRDWMTLDTSPNLSPSGCFLICQMRLHLGNGFQTRFNLVTLCSNKSHMESPRYKTFSVSPPLKPVGDPEPQHTRRSLITYMVLHKGALRSWKPLDQMTLEVHSSSEKSKIYKPCFVLIAPGQYQLLTSLLKY